MLTTAQLAERWAMSPTTLKLQRSRRRGAPYVRLPGGAIRYRLSDIEKIEQAGLVRPR